MPQIKRIRGFSMLLMFGTCKWRYLARLWSVVINRPGGVSQQARPYKYMMVFMILKAQVLIYEHFKPFYIILC